MPLKAKDRGTLEMPLKGEVNGKTYNAKRASNAPWAWKKHHISDACFRSYPLRLGNEWTEASVLPGTMQGPGKVAESAGGVQP